MKNLITILTITSLIISCKSPEARAPERVKTGTFLKASAQRNKALNEKEKEQILKLIKQDPEHEYIASESGFWYCYTHRTTKQDTITAKFGDILDFEYRILDLKGSVIYDTQRKKYAMDKQELFTGLREGLKLMKANEQITFIFPSQKAYGYYGDDKKIGTNIPLICNVTLNSITQNND